MNLALPLIGQYSWKVQACILSVLIVSGYLYGRVRQAATACIIIYSAYQAIWLLVPWATWIFRSVAWCGFYVFFFLRAVEYGGELWQFAVKGVDLVASEHLKHSLSQERDNAPPASQRTDEYHYLKQMVSERRREEQTQQWEDIQNDYHPSSHGSAVFEELEDDDDELPDLQPFYNGTAQSAYDGHPTWEDVQNASTTHSAGRSHKKRNSKRRMR
jgi:hypothetical protein